MGKSRANSSPLFQGGNRGVLFLIQSQSVDPIQNRLKNSLGILPESRPINVGWV